MAGLAAGLSLPYECSSGTCGSCKAVLRSGEILDRFPTTSALSDRDRRKNRILLCQCEAKSDVTLSVTTLDGLAEPIPKDLELTVEALERHGPNLVSMRTRAAADVAFLPGQYVLLKVPGVGRRAYSMSNAPASDQCLEFIIKAVPGGAATRYIFNELNTGTTIAAEGPFGRAYLRQTQERGIRCVAGGSGLAPVLSIARAALPLGFEVDLYYGARTPDDLVCTDDFEALKSANPDRFRSTVSISEPNSESGWKGRVGPIGDVFFEDVRYVADRPLYMAGPPAMVDAMLKGCVIDRAVPADRIFFDRFF